MFESHTPNRAPAVLRPCRFTSDFWRQRHSTAEVWHGTRELSSAVSRRPVGDLPRFGFFRLPITVPRLASSNVSGYKRTFTKGTARHVRTTTTRTAGARHSVCELAFKIPCCLQQSNWYVITDYAFKPLVFVGLNWQRIASITCQIQLSSFARCSNKQRKDKPEAIQSPYFVPRKPRHI